MPLVKVECSGTFSGEKKAEACLALSKICSAAMGKPEAYVMCAIIDGMSAVMVGKAGACAFVDVKGIGGFSASVNGKLSSEICSCLEKKLAISPSSVYINFTDISASNWGWNGKTFA
jgi:phenylpyruvate tautomerase PptA (4-oxalocrotonate tautomerase family)